MKNSRAVQIQLKHGNDLVRLFKVCDSECVRRTSTNILVRFEFKDKSALLVAKAPFTMLDVVDLGNAVDQE